MRMNRRNFLRAVSAACATETIAEDFSRFVAAPQAPHISFPIEPRSRIGISAWAFRSVIDAPLNDERDPRLNAMDMKDFGAYVREEFNVVNIEPYNRYFRSLEPAYLEQFRHALDKARARPAEARRQCRCPRPAPWPAGQARARTARRCP